MEVFTTDDPELFKIQALRWAAGYDYVACVDSGGFTGPPPMRESWLLGVGIRRHCLLTSNDNLARFDNWLCSGRWVFLAIAYDLQLLCTPLKARRRADSWPLIWAFEPAVFIRIVGDNIEIEAPDAHGVFNTIRLKSALPANSHVPMVDVRATVDFATYNHVFDQIQADIAAGDYYEINYCLKFIAEFLPDINIVEWYLALSKANRAPHGAFWKFGSQALLCCSPERFLARRGDKLFSQPIKGTSQRSDNPAADRQSANDLRNSVKDSAEHIMIVDLVRNDLTQIAVPQTIQVEELQGIYSFAKVHQMISTVTCTARPDLSWEALFRATFPMGSMTGAPKLMAMKRIDAYEKYPRGLYSGSVGYIAPNGDFDLNVVIRSWLADTQNRYAEVTTGGAVVFDSTAESEYEECLLKLKGLGAQLKSDPADVRRV